MSNHQRRTPEEVPQNAGFVTTVEGGRDARRASDTDEALGIYRRDVAGLSGGQ